MTLDLFQAEPRKCVFSPDMRHRYTLWREFWHDGENGDKFVQFIGLNPSTADDEVLDPTVRRCVNYAKSWGYGALCMTNIFAYRATLPDDMKRIADPVGEDNDYWLKDISKNAGIVIAAWGTHGGHLRRSDVVKNMIPNLYCLKTTQDGHPSHPLYLKKDLVPVRFV